MSTTKKIMSAIAAIVLIVSVVMGSFAFKAVDKQTTVKVVSVDQWYSITPLIDNDDPTEQKITATISAPPSTSFTDCAITGNTAKYCAVLLRFPGAAPSLNSGTVQDAIDNHSAQIVAGVGTGGYSRLPL